jgi:tetratricopeptide (TPR) repeat protein
MGRSRRLLAWVLLALLGGSLSPPAWGDQTDPALPGLFERLKAAPDPTAAGPIETAIWEAWTRHPDPVVEQLMDKAALAMRLGDRGQAQRALDQIVALAPDYAEGWNRRATFRYLIGRYSDSLADIDRVLALEPRHFGALSGQGLVLVALDRPEEAIAAFTAALAIHPNMLGVLENLRALQGDLGKDI